MAPEDAGAWDDGSRGYRGNDGYLAIEGGDYDYGPDGGYPGQGPEGYGQYDGDPYTQQPYGGYRPEQGQGGGYAGSQGHEHDDYGYGQSTGYAQRQGYDQRSAPDFREGYRDPNAGYAQSGGYPTSRGDEYYKPRHGSGAYPALPSGSGRYPAQDAGNDWYGGQPAAANGASFAGTGTYALNGRVGDEYGTGPREAVRDPVRGYPPRPGQRGSGPMPGPARTALPASSPSAAETRQQERLDDSAAGPGRASTGNFRGASAAGRRGPAAGAFQTGAGGDAVDDRGGNDDYLDDFYDPGTADDPYQDRFDDADPPRTAGGGGRGPGRAAGGRPRRSPLGGKRLLTAAVGVVAFGIIAAAVYVFLIKPSPSSDSASATGPLPTGSTQPSQQACVKQLGTYCHITKASDDPKPLTVDELYPPAFTNEKDKTSYSLVSTKLDTKCANAVIGQSLTKALNTGKCKQAVRASYVSGDGKIMGTIGVLNLATTNEAHYAGKVVGKSDFIAPLTSKTGVASKLGNGTGVVEAEFKGHYLILTWCEYVDGTVPKTKAQDSQLEQFNSDLVMGTANIALTQRMVTGAPATPGAPS